MRKHLVIIFLIIIALGCKKSPTEWDVNVGFPIVKSSLTIRDILPDEYISVDTNNQVWLNFDYDFIQFEPDSIFKIDDIVFDTSYGTPFDLTVTPNLTFISDPNESIIQAGNASLTEIVFESGMIEYEIQSKINTPTIYIATIYNSEFPDGNSFTQEIYVPAGSQTTPAIKSGVFDISNLKIDLTGTDGNQTNTIKTLVKIKSSPDAATTVVPTTDSIYISNSFKNLKIKYAKGYFGNQSFSFSGITPFNLFHNITSGNIDIENVAISLQTNNYIGADFQVTFNEINSINENTSQAVSLSHDLIQQPKNYTRANDNNGYITPTNYNYELNSSNSNIQAFIENLPSRLDYDIDFEMNPLGDASLQNDFIYPNKNTIEALMNIQMPLSIIAQNLTLIDTINFGISSSVSDIINDGKMNIFVKNGFPLNANITLYIADENGLYDSIMLNNMIDAAFVNTSNISISQNESTIYATLKKETIQQLTPSSKMILKVIFNTQDYSSLNNTHMKVYDDYKFDIQITTELNAHVKID